MEEMETGDSLGRELTASASVHGAKAREESRGTWRWGASVSSGPVRERGSLCQ